MSESKKEILLGDCLELMKDIPNGSIDMILCDLPYGTTACNWDTIIPFNKLWEHYERIIKDNGAIVITSAEPFTSALIMSNVKLFKYRWTWNKSRPTNHLNAKKQPLRVIEDVCVFYKKQAVYNPQLRERKRENIRTTNYIPDTSKNTVYGKIRTDYKYNEGRVIDIEKGYPLDYIEIVGVGTNSKEGRFHATQKPIALFEYLIKTYTNEGDLVLDNTAGSGTTAIACLNTNRQFIVMEKEQKYYDIILKRLADYIKKVEVEKEERIEINKNSQKFW
jgi:site-specific DNA-methyltransferase (adenine-specific)